MAWWAPTSTQKLHRIGLISFIATDLQSALTSAALLGPGDVALGISHTGTTTDVVDALRVARRQGAMTIAVTNYARSPITAEADLILVTAARETTFRTGAMASRIGTRRAGLSVCRSRPAHL